MQLVELREVGGVWNSSADSNESCADEFVAQILPLWVAGGFKNTAASAPRQTSQDAAGEQRLEVWGMLGDTLTHNHRHPHAHTHINTESKVERRTEEEKTGQERREKMKKSSFLKINYKGSKMRKVFSLRETVTNTKHSLMLKLQQLGERDRDNLSSGGY